MHYDVFDAEQWMTKYEKQVRVNLADTSAAALTFSELASMEPALFDSLILDYGEIAGDQKLRDLILKRYQNQDNETLALAHGCLQANCTVMEALLNAGDHVITFLPGYSQFVSLPGTLGAEVTTVESIAPDFRPDLEAFKAAIQPETKLIIVNHANNPTGYSFSDKEMQTLIDLARAHDAWILCDEVYKFPGSPSASISDLYEKGIATGSLSKLYGTAGIRLGWIKGPKELIDKINIMKDYTWISTGPLADAAALAVLKHEDELMIRCKELIRKNIKVIQDWLKDSKYFDCVIHPEATVAFLKYKAPLSSVELSRRLIEDLGIFFVPGEFFGKDGYLRLGLAQKQDNLKEHLMELEAYLEHLNKE